MAENRQVTRRSSGSPAGSTNARPQLSGALVSLTADRWMPDPETGAVLTGKRGWRCPRLPESVSRESVEAAAAEWRASLRPAGRAAVVDVLTRLAMHFWTADRPEHHFEPLIEDYAGDLAHLPADVLHEVAVTWRRTQKWFPKIAELLAMAEPEIERRREMLRRLEQLAVSPRPEKRIAAEPEQTLRRWSDLTDEEKARHEEMMRPWREPGAVVEEKYRPRAAPVEMTDEDRDAVLRRLGA